MKLKFKTRVARLGDTVKIKSGFNGDGSGETACFAFGEYQETHVDRDGMNTEGSTLVSRFQAKRKARLPGATSRDLSRPAQA